MLKETDVIFKHTEEVRIELAAEGLADLLGVGSLLESPPPIILSLPVTLILTGLAMRLIQQDGKRATQHANQSMIDLLVQARRWWAQLSDGASDIPTIARAEGINDSWITRVVRLNFLSPEIVTAILSGEQPAALNPSALSNSGTLPPRWDEQLGHFGFA